MESTSRIDPLLNTKAVLTEIFNDQIHPATLRRMWQRGDIPPPMQVGGQNCWFKSMLEQPLKEKRAAALRLQSEIQAQHIPEAR